LIYTADYLVTLDGSILENGAVEIIGNKITEIYSVSNFPKNQQNEIRKFSDTILMPGLINCHAHLELGWSRGLFPQKELFSMWVTRLQKAQEKVTSNNIEDSIRLGILECIKNGTTTIADIGNTPYPLQLLSKDVIRSIVYQELIGLDPEVSTKNFKLKSKGLQLFNKSALRSDICRPALAVHAPFSCSHELIENVVQASYLNDVPFTLHLGESSDEWELFTESSGRLLELCRKKFPAFKLFNQSPFEYMVENKLLPEKSLVAHCNYLDETHADFFALQNISIVHCPRSHEFFGHKEFPFELCHNKGINVCLGTDSLGSNENLSMFEEMSKFKSDFPQVECIDILKMATVNGAQALNMQQMGKLKKGYFADIIGINLKHNPSFDLIDEIVCEEYDVNCVLINGNEVMI